MIETSSSPATATSFLPNSTSPTSPLEPDPSLHAANRAKLASLLRRDATEASTAAVVYLLGAPSETRHDTDHEPIFRQESYFHYLFGVREPDAAAILDVTTGRTVLAIPRLPKEYATFMGRIKSCDDFRVRYGVEDCCYVDELEGRMEALLGLSTSEGGGEEKKENGGGGDDGKGGDAAEVAGTTTTTASASLPAAASTTAKVLLLQGPNTDSGKSYPLPPKFRSEALNAIRDVETLFPILCDARVRKTPSELRLLRHVTELTSFAHVYVMRNTRPGMYEYQSESLFRHYCYYNYGCRLLGYTAICGCGPSGAVLHYGHAGEPNGRRIEEGDSCLYDMGAELGGYGSDVTCSFPAVGTFTERQRAVYEGVLDAQRVVIGMLKPGVSWVDCHKAAEGEILKALVRLGVVKTEGKTIEELVEMRLGAVFMPHGLGHFIGVDTHDVGGYLPGHPPRIDKPGLKALRTSRVMEPNMVITVEPGCYFIDHLLDEALSSDSDLKSHLAAEVVESYRGFGGVRLEDVVAVTEDGCVNYTLCPRTVQEVERAMAGGKWPPTKDDAPELKRERLTDPNPLPLPSPPSL